MAGCYTALAAVYDQLSDDYDYKSWAAYYKRKLEENGIPAQNAYVLDAACGTGNLTLPLLEFGMEVVGCDKSPDMLRVAGEKLRRHGYRIPLVQQDMCKITLPRKADAVVCACDGVNYLCSLEEMEAFFQAAYATLKPEGILLFDISSRYKLETVLGNQLYAEERDDVAYIWKNQFFPQERILEMDITFFIREGELFRRQVELHRQRAYEIEEILNSLQKTGFRLESVEAGFQGEPVEEDSLRVHFTAKKA